MRDECKIVWNFAAAAPDCCRQFLLKNEIQFCHHNTKKLAGWRAENHSELCRPVYLHRFEVDYHIIFPIAVKTSANKKKYGRIASSFNLGLETLSKHGVVFCLQILGYTASGFLMTLWHGECLGNWLSGMKLVNWVQKHDKRSYS